MHIGTNPKKFNITEEENTKLISEKFSELISKGDIICLHENLGSGKNNVY
jgi:Predicted ATPase or kinase